MFLGIDPLYWIMMIPTLLFSMWASLKVKRAFAKFSKKQSFSGLTGEEVAKKILKINGLQHISVVETGGFLSDHYDPIRKVIRLSPKVFNSSSISALGVAAHETGHAIQHAKSYKPLIFRNAIAPTASIGSNLAWIILIFGFIINYAGLIKLGILLFSIVVIFQLITLPVEFNASTRAKAILTTSNIISSNELVGVKSVLSAAAMTYVAAAASSVITLLYFLIRAGFLGNDD
ncbi:MAG: zinc metallopeptidase [Spirochaetota bacterium]|nr:zinc metallopeptidase [Spirochaetota bacterium]